MERYYITETHQGHIKTLKVKKQSLNPKTNWEYCLYVDLPNIPKSDEQACQWRDDIIDAICKSTNKPHSFFFNWNKNFYDQV